MELKVKYSSRFKKGLRLAVKRGLDLSLLEEVVENLKAGIPLDARFKDHPLTGNYKGYRECHIQPDWLLIYLIEENILTLTLVDTGTHADLFKM
ncbi:MAG: type II toxin-antitoxin system YafQ family toxin [Lachnospiraceae bacterium]|nr:type II toxin-antitoxin system YafQ family toxin [Lachnospiraceae bacterium]